MYVISITSNDDTDEIIKQNIRAEFPRLLGFY